MKLFAVQAYGNYAGGVVIVRAEDEATARGIAAKYRGGSDTWNIRYGKPDQVEEIDLTGTGVLYNYETGE